MSLLFLSVLDCRHVEFEVDAIAEHEAAGLERHVPGEAPIASLQRAASGDADAALTVGIDARALVRQLELDGPGDRLDGEIADDTKAVVAERGHARALEGHRRVTLDIEEVARAQVGVAVR